MYKVIMSFIAAGVLLSLTACGGKSKEELFSEGVRELEGGNANGAIVLLKNALEKDQNNQDVRYQLAKAYLKLGKYEQAEKEFRKVQAQNPSRVEISLELAKIFNSTGKPDKAIPEAEKFLSVKAGSSEGHEVLGTAHSIGKNVKEAERHFREALAAEPGRASAKLQLASLYMGTERVNEARALLDELIRVEPKNTRAYYLLASHEARIGNSAKALEYYRTILGIDPADPVAPFRIGLIHLAAKEYDKSDKIADELMAKFPKRGEGPRLKGFVAYQRKNFTEAITHLQNSMKLQPTLEGYHYLGLSMYQKGDLESALSQFRRVLDVTPAFVQARTMTAMILLNQKRVDDAISEANKVVQAEPNNALARNVLGSALLAKGMYEEGMRELNKATELDPKFVDAHIKKGVIHLSKGQTREAELDLTTAVRVAPEVLNSRLMLAGYHLRRNNFAKAMAVLKEGVKGDKGDAVLYNTMATVMFAERKPTEGVKFLQKAKESDPGFSPASFNLATYHAASGNYDHAAAEYQGVIQRDPRNLRAILGMAAVSELKGKDSDALAWYVKAKEVGGNAGYLALADYHSKRKESAKALVVLDEAVKAIPKNIEALLAKGQLLAAEKKFKEAIKAFDDVESIAPDLGLPMKVAAYVQMKEGGKAVEQARRIIALKPNSASGYTVLASVYESQGDTSRALQEVQNGLRVEPKSIRATMQLGDLHARNRNMGAAMSAYDSALRINPDYAPAYFSQGALLEMNGKRKEAVGKYQTALAKSENFVPALNNLAFLYADGYGPSQESLRMAVRAFKQEPGNPAIMDTFGYALLKNGRKDDARKFLEKAASQMANNPSVRYHLAMAYHETGDRAKAVSTLEQIVKQGNFPELESARQLLAKLNGSSPAGQSGKRK